MSLIAAAARRRLPPLPHPLVFTALIPVVLIALPVVYIAIRAWQAGAAGVLSELARRRTLELLVNTLSLALAVTAFGCLIAIATAWLVERSDLWGRRGWRVLVALPLAVPAFVSSYAWSSFDAALQGMGGAILILTLSTYPLIYLPVAAALRSLDPALEDVSRSLGRGSWGTFLAVTLPQVRPALGAGALLVFTHMLAEFGALSLLRVRTFTTSIFASYELQFDSASAALQSAVLMALCLPAVYGEMRLRSRMRVARAGRGAGRRIVAVRLGKGRFAAAVLLAILVAAALGVPVATLGYWFVTGTSRGNGLADTWATISGSLSLALPGTVIVTLLALPLVLASRRANGLAAVADGLPYVVHAVPGLVVALALVFLSIHYARPFYQSAALVFVAYAALFLPLAQSPLRASIELVPRRLEEVARGLGRSPPAAFVSITLPLIAPGIGAAMALMTLELMRELTATLLLAPTGIVTLSIEVWSYTNDTEYAAAAPFALLLVALSAVPVYGFTRRSLELRDL